MGERGWSIFDPVKWTHIPTRERTASAMGREALNALWAQESKDYVERERVPEAVCRGYHGKRGESHALTEARDVPLAPGDEMSATRAWLTYAFGKEPLLSEVPYSEAALVGCSRYLWRAAVGALIRRPVGQVEYPSSYLMFLVREMVERRIKDPRGDVGYFASDTWPKSLILFAQAALPYHLRDG